MKTKIESKDRKLYSNLTWIWWREGAKGNIMAIARANICEVRCNPIGKENWIRLDGGMLYSFTANEMKQLIAFTNIGE